jgi:hypothetical protein
MALLTYFGLLLVAARANPYADKTLQARELVRQAATVLSLALEGRMSEA